MVVMGVGLRESASSAPGTRSFSLLTRRWRAASGHARRGRRYDESVLVLAREADVGGEGGLAEMPGARAARRSARQDEDRVGGRRRRVEQLPRLSSARPSGPPSGRVRSSPAGCSRPPSQWCLLMRLRSVCASHRVPVAGAKARPLGKSWSSSRTSHSPVDESRASSRPARGVAGWARVGEPDAPVGSDQEVVGGPRPGNGQVEDVLPVVPRSAFADRAGWDEASGWRARRRRSGRPRRSRVGLGQPVRSATGLDGAADTTALEVDLHDQAAGHRHDEETAIEVNRGPSVKPMPSARTSRERRDVIGSSSRGRRAAAAC